jgi:hypothetical protein
MSAAPGSKISGPYRRIYEENFVQRMTIDRSPENILLLAIDLAYAPSLTGGGSSVGRARALP